MTKDAALSLRKTAKQSRSEATVDAILEAAARILETDGFGKYSTNEIARRAGVSIGSLYQYFPNKDAVTRELSRRQTVMLVDEIGAVFAEKGQNCALSELIDIAVRHQFRRPVLAKLLDAEETRLRRDPEQDFLANQVCEHIIGGLEDIGFPGEKSEAARDIMAIIRGMVDAASDRDERDPSRLILRVRRAAMGYLSPPK